jgi:hypothetical protein
VGCVHAENEDNTMNFVDQDGKDSLDVSLVLFPTRHEVVVSDPNQALPLYDLNRDDGMCEASAEEDRHSEQDQRAAVKADSPNRLQESYVLWVKLILKADGHDYNKDLNDGGDHHFWDHPMDLVVAEDVAEASSGDPLERHLPVGDHHEI